MKIEDVVMKLVGDIKPIGETNADNIRLANLKELTALVDGLLQNIHEVTKNKNSHEFSRQQAARFASQFLIFVSNEIIQVASANPISTYVCNRRNNG